MSACESFRPLQISLCCSRSRLHEGSAAPRLRLTPAQPGATTTQPQRSKLSPMSPLSMPSS
eukprot:13577297-Alexandrium_andersonii.AAC.1